MSTEGKDTADGTDPLKDDAALWDLLGRPQPPAPVSPYFARRVLREIALDEETGGGGWWARLWPLRMPAPRYMAACTGAFACAVLGLATWINQPHPRAAAPRQSPTISRPAEETAAGASAANRSIAASEDLALTTGDPTTPESADAGQDAEVIADLDNILDFEESRLWTEDTARF